MERKQFTFYYSFYDVIRCIPSKTQRADAYDAICAYALLGEIPNMDSLGMGAKMVLKICMPILEAAGKKAAGGMKKESPCEDAAKLSDASDEDMENKNKDKDKNKNKDKNKDKDKCLSQGTDGFDIFWNEYPVKIGKKAAREAFQMVDADRSVILDALHRQKTWEQWNRDNGRYIPKPETWLKERRWEDQQPQVQDKPPMGASGELGDAELAAIRRMMEETVDS